MKRSIFTFLLLVTGSLYGQTQAQPVDSSRKEHGRAQAQQIFADRFMMSAYRTKTGEVRKVTEEDSIYQWLSQSFAGDGTNEIIFWNSDPPTEHLADHIPPSERTLGYLRLARSETSRGTRGTVSRYLTFEQLWVGAVFELISIRRLDRWNLVEADAKAGKLTKEEFIEAAARIEFGSLEASAEFYTAVWLPWANATGFKSDKTLWRVPLPPYEVWRASYTDRAGYPWKPFEKMFDSLQK